MPSRRTTIREVALLKQLHEQGQLTLAPEFQRNSVWPRPAKAHLIDSILRDRPIPPLFFHRTASAQQRTSTYTVIDGQQRLRAVFDFVDNLYSLTKAEGEERAGKRFDDLSLAEQQSILNYDFVIEELAGYTVEDIEDIFTRANQYVVKLNPAEIRNAKEKGRFADEAKEVGAWPYWQEKLVFTPTQISRMRPIEFSAELFILLSEGPQDKKTSIDVWYAQYRKRFPGVADLKRTLASYLDWIAAAIPSFTRSRWRKPVDLYSIIGALDRVVQGGTKLSNLDQEAIGTTLLKLEDDLKEAASAAKDPRSEYRPSAPVARYIVAASRQTDNLVPRSTRIGVIEDLIRQTM